MCVLSIPIGPYHPEIVELDFRLQNRRGTEWHIIWDEARTAGQAREIQMINKILSIMTAFLCGIFVCIRSMSTTEPLIESVAVVLVCLNFIAQFVVFLTSKYCFQKHVWQWLVYKVTIAWLVYMAAEVADSWMMKY